MRETHASKQNFGSARFCCVSFRENINIVRADITACFQISAHAGASQLVNASSQPGGCAVPRTEMKGHEREKSWPKRRHWRGEWMRIAPLSVMSRFANSDGRRDDSRGGNDADDDKHTYTHTNAQYTHAYLH